ncbi:hypothetical protein [Methyloprofundus sp.]|uniref:hypothetical protein n=1 Tax=Methyloprofundus sp. TaxID=2020875 RepID=UPI003D0A2324
MKYEDIYNLSMRFAPPKVDLRKAQIQDDYGDESFAKLTVDHKKPDDVKREEFDYYGWVYPFMEPEDLLFYLYAMVIEFSNDQEIDCIESFMYSMDREISVLQAILSGEEQQTLKNAFQQIWDISGHDYIVFAQCKNLQKLIGITVEV